MDNSKIKTLLIDGYLDEPSCLGVPPYISPHIRYTYGALLTAGLNPEKITYRTIDQLRDDHSYPGDKKNSEDNSRGNQFNYEWMEGFDLVIIIAGTTVPGHYLGGKPISLAELKRLGEKLFYPQKVLGGPITLVKRDINGFDHICSELAALDLYQIMSKEEINTSPENLARFIGEWARAGAELTRLHPGYPNLVCEIETFRGCPRSNHCAFCSERLKKITYTRTPEQVIEEVRALATAGNHYYRLGCQTDLLSYQASCRKSGELIPSPEALKRLYSGIREADPDLKVLHLDNINPAGIVRYEPESRQILETITRYNTPGDVAAFGLESADPVVLRKNNIETDAEGTLQAVRILNEIGGKREKGVPLLLPGLNFLHGLLGERAETMFYNYEFLKKILDQGLMLRRINIRQVVRLDKYPVVNVDHGKFISYKERINKEINKPMLQRVFPTGTILENVLTETREGKISYGRQLGSYPILVGIPGRLDLNEFVTVRVVDHGYRSITALPWPFKLKNTSLEQLTSIPGIGEKRARSIFLNQPDSLAELRKLLGPGFPLEKWQDWFIF